ncbi:hypothetical protein EMCRGX_G019757 [Ephydatia muelleri]
MASARSRVAAAMVLNGPPDFLKYLCVVCKFLLKDAVQTSCGHWLCQECAEDVFRAAASRLSPPRCPQSNCGEELESTDGCNYYPDRYVRKEILNMSVRCVHYAEGCLWTGIVSLLEGHLGSCEYVYQLCPSCNARVIITMVKQHESVCPKASQLCCPLQGLGCGHQSKMSRDELNSHLSGEGLIHHMSILASVIKTASTYDNEVEPSGNTRRIASRGSKMEIDGAEHTDSYLSVNTHMNELVCKEVSKLKTELESVFQVEAKDAEISRLKVQMSSLEKKVQGKETENEDRGFRLSLLENVNYDGTMIWKIPQFAQRMADAQSGKYTSIFSLPFYTSRYGHKLCLRLYILGDGIGKGTHMSLFFVVMRGEFDNILQWPFTHKVTFRLLNQGAGQDVVDSFLPDPMSSSFKKPKTDMNVASGCPRFVSISDVKSGGFIADDTIFIKVKVDVTRVRNGSGIRSDQGQIESTMELVFSDGFGLPQSCGQSSSKPRETILSFWSPETQSNS